MMHPPHIIGPSTSLSGNNSALQSSVLSDGALLSHSQPTREEIKKSFVARDGIYRVVQSAELSRPRPLPHYQMPAGIASAAASQMAAAGSSVRVSFLEAPESSKKRNTTGLECSSSSSSQGANGSISREDQNIEDAPADLICFNVGKELYVYSYRGIQTETDLSRPIDKRVYKGTSPTYHLFNKNSYTARSCQLLIGFTLGQLQVIDPLEKTIPSPVSKLYNEDRWIDKTAVTCIQWYPEDPNIFVASYTSGNLYVYDERIPAATSGSNGSSNPPPWNVEKEGEKYTVYGWKSKVPRNPIARWKIGEGTIHEFEFSSDKRMMATVSHDGFLRVFNYESRDLIATMKSYFGGLLTLSWSHDSKLVATGGEDDLLTVFHVLERRVVCRGQAHKSWISQVKFDPHARWLKEGNKRVSTTTTSPDEGPRDVTMRPELIPSTSTHSDLVTRNPTGRTGSCSEFSNNDVQDGTILYRIGSVGHDTCLCFWDITKNMMNQNLRRHRNSTVLPHSHEGLNRADDAQDIVADVGVSIADSQQIVADPLPPTTHPVKQKKKGRFIKRLPFTKFSSGSGTPSGSSAGSQRESTANGAVTNPETARRIPVLASQISCCVETRVLGTSVCPGIKEVPMIEPVMCKKVAHDRLTVLEFRPDCVVTACQEGYICTWARPSEDGKTAGVKTPSVETPDSEQKPSVSAAASSYGYGSEVSNGIGPSRSSSVYSHYEQQLRSPNASSPSYRVTAASTSVYHRPAYAWQNAN